MRLKSFLVPGVAAAALAGPALAIAEVTYDVGDATDAITAGMAAVATIGVAALVMVVGIKVWKRIRGAA